MKPTRGNKWYDISDCFSDTKGPQKQGVHFRGNKWYDISDCFSISTYLTSVVSPFGAGQQVVRHL